jgi:DNA-binding response OmpR family regulator
MLSEKLLIVDDAGDLRKLLRLTLGYGIYQMYEADNGKTALELAKSVEPDVIVLDVMMPGELDGFQVCEAVKKDEKLSTCFVVLLTARGQKADRDEGRRVGADAYIVKPFSPNHLIEVIETRRRNR